MFPDEIETERLRLVRLCRENVPTMQLYRHTRTGAPYMSEVSEYVMWDPHETPKDTHDYLTDIEEQWDDCGQATYAIYLRDDEKDSDEYPARADQGVEDELVGTTNLHIDWERRSAELGIWLRKPFWGRGYSGERAAAMLELAFDRLDLELVGASHQVGNEQSRRAIEKYVERFGGQHDGVLRNFVPKDGEVRDLHRYTISREQYREATDDRTSNDDNTDDQTDDNTDDQTDDNTDDQTDDQTDDNTDDQTDDNTDDQTDDTLDKRVANSEQ